MLNKIVIIIKHLIYAIISNILYGLAVFFLYKSLVGHSLLYVYIVNIALILIFLALDDTALNVWNSKKFILEIKKDKDIDKSYRYIQLYFDSFVSFKTILYLFYIFIVIVAQIIEFYPTLINKDLENFIIANRYSILLLIAFDQLILQFSNDKEKIKKIYN